MIRATRWWIVCVVFVGALRQLLYAEDGGLMIGGVGIKLGMPQAEAMELIQKDLKLVRRGDEESYTLFSRAGPPYKLLGGVSFQDGKVDTVDKRWGEYSGSGVTELANALVGTLDYAAMPATITVHPCGADP